MASGRWSWIYTCGEEPEYSKRTPGRHAPGCFCLPPAFGDRTFQTGLLRKVNIEFGTLLDYFEEEDIRWPEALRFVAESVEEAFVGHDLEPLVREVAAFLRDSADAGRCVTFWL